MAFGILEPKGARNVPGTTLLNDHTLSTIPGRQGLKTGTGKSSHIILVPQPSDDPNDPLNWPLWQRDLILLLWCACSLAIVGGLGPILSPLTGQLILEFGINFTQVSQLTGYTLLGTACIGIFISAFCRKFGNRGPLIFSVSCAFAGSLWAGAAQSYGSLLGGRILQGCGISLFEAITYVVISDLYFVHQRGSRTAAFVSCLSALGNIPVIAAGNTADTLGWRWVFWLLALFIGVLWLLCILFGWETTYNNRRSEIVASSETDMSETNDFSKAEVKRVEHAEHLSTSDQGTQRTGFWKRMSPYSGILSDESILSMTLRPLLICVHPAVIWAFLTLAFPVLWTVGVTLVTAQIFSAPPYLFTATQLGYISVGAVVGGLLACLLCGWLSDFVAKRLALSNGGVYEPEFRLVLVAGLAICSALGYFLFGNLAAEGKSAVGMAALYGVIVAGNQFSAVVVGTYMVDAFPEINIETFIITMVGKNLLFFGFTFFVNDWLVSWGPARMFDCIGGIQLGLCLLTLPLWMFGKKLRLWWSSSRMRKIF